MAKSNLVLTDSLAVRNRPRKFSEIVGNTSNIKTIKGFLQRGQLPRTWLFSGEPGSGKCITGDSLISTPKGFFKIKELVGDNEGYTGKVIPVYTKDGQANTSHVYRESNCKTIRLTTSNGFTIEGTEDHPVYVSQGRDFIWKKLKDIELGDMLCFNKQPYFSKENYSFKDFTYNISSDDIKNQVSISFTSCNEYVARFIGYLLANGYLYDDMILFHTNKHQIQEDYFKIVKRLFNYTPEIFHPDNNLLSIVDVVSEESISEDYNTSVITSSCIVSFVKSILSSRRENLEIPNCILQSTKSVIKEMILAFTNSISKVTSIGTLLLEHNSHELLKQIHIILLHFNIFARLFRSDTTDNYIISYYNINHYLSTFGITDISLYENPSGLHHELYTNLCNAVTQKLSSLGVIHENPWDFIFDDVEKIAEFDEGKTVYDITVPEFESFIANGMIVHNTTSARILSMIVNCENIGENIKKGIVEPCLECNSCKLAMAGKHPDILEINAGGEEGNVQGIRDILDRIKLSPRFGVRCFIIDECLPGNTEVLLGDGSTATMKELAENREKDYRIMTYNVENDELEICRMTDAASIAERKVLNLILENGDNHLCSANHKWYCYNKKDYIPAEDLKAGDEVLEFNMSLEEGFTGITSKPVKIKNVFSTGKKELLYDITVEQNHNFLVKVSGNRYVLSSNCHNLSNAARQNLLKPLEEPPSHVLWALCTTDPDKLPKAALTRCIKLYYSYPSLGDASKRLWKVAKEEYPSEIHSRLKPYIKKIAENTNCQMRDSYSLLESLGSILSDSDDISDEELAVEFTAKLSSLGDLTTPSIRYITYALLDKYSLPLGILNDLEPTRFADFINMLGRHSHYASLFFIHKKEDTLKDLKKNKFFGINFVRFDQALNDVWDKLIKKYSTKQIQYKIVSLCSSILEAINKNRMGLLTPEQAILCATNLYMEKMQSLSSKDE